MINTMIAVLVALDLLTEEEGELLAVKIRQGTLPQDFSSSLRQARVWVEEAKKSKT